MFRLTLEKSVGHSLKNLGPFQKTLRPPWCPSWLRACICVQQLFIRWDKTYGKPTSVSCLWGNASFPVFLLLLWYFLNSNKAGFLLIFVTAGRACFQQNSLLSRSFRKR